MTPLARFDVCWVELPYQQGHAQHGRRPGVIIADVPRDGFAIVAPVTTSFATRRYTGTMPVVPDGENNLRESSLVLGFQLRYLHRDRVRGRIGRLGVEDQAELDGILAELLGFDG